MNDEKKQDDFKPFDRDKVLILLSNTISKLNYKLDKGRITNIDNEKIRIQQYRGLVYSMDVYNKILKDRQIDNLQDELEAIKLALINKEYEDNKDSEQSEKVEQLLDEVENTIENA